MTLIELSQLPTAEKRAESLQQEVYRLNGVVAAQQSALAHWRRESDLDSATIKRLRDALYLIAHGPVATSLTDVAKTALGEDCIVAMGRKHQPFEPDLEQSNG